MLDCSAKTFTLDIHVLQASEDISWICDVTHLLEYPKSDKKAGKETTESCLQKLKTFFQFKLGADWRSG